VEVLKKMTFKVVPPYIVEEKIEKYLDETRQEFTQNPHLVGGNVKLSVAHVQFEQDLMAVGIEKTFNEYKKKNLVFYTYIPNGGYVFHDQTPKFD
jgi:uncharacterized membrane protein YjdF